MRIVKRNLYRLPNLLEKLPPIPAKPASPRDSEGVSAPARGEDSAEERAECSVCGFGSLAPPLNFVLSSPPAEHNEERIVFRAARLRGRPPSEGNTHRVLFRMRSIYNSFANDLDSFAKRLVKSRNEEKIPFSPNGRGRFWRCIGCDCVVHEHCLDFKDQWMLFQDAQFKCTVSPFLQCRLHVSELPLRGPADELAALHVLLLALRPASDGGERPRGLVGGLLLHLWAERWVSHHGVEPRVCAQAVRSVLSRNDL